MNYKLTISLAVLLLAAVVAVWIASSRTTTAPKEINDLLGENPPAIVAIAYSHGGGAPSVAFEKVGDDWFLTTPVRAKAIGNVKNMAEDLRKLKFTDKFAAEPSGARSLKDTGLEKPTDSLEIKDATGKVQTLDIGKRTTEGAFFATLKGSNTIVLLSSNAATPYTQNANSFRNKELLSIDRGEQAIKRVAITSAKTTVELAPDVAASPFTTTWRIEKPTPARASMAAARGVISQVSRLSVSDFTTISRLVAGLDQPRLTVTLTVQGKIDGLAGDVAVAATGTAPASAAATAATRTVTLQFGDQAERDGKTVFAAMAGSDEVFILPVAAFDALNKSLDDLRDRRVFPDGVEPSTATEISLTDNAKNTSFKLTRGGTEEPSWTFVLGSTGEGGRMVPRTYEGNGQAINILLMAMKNLTASDFPSAGDLKALGLDPPLRTISLKLEGGKTEELLVGNAVPAPAANLPAKTAVARKGDLPVFVNTGMLADILPTPLTLRSAVVSQTSTDEIKTVEVTAKDASKSFTLTRTGAGVWQVTMAGKGASPADFAKTITFVSDLTPLSAKSWLRQAADPKIEAGTGDFVVKITTEEAISKAESAGPAKNPSTIQFRVDGTTLPGTAGTQASSSSAPATTTTAPGVPKLGEDTMGPAKSHEVVKIVHLYKLAATAKAATAPATVPATEAATAPAAPAAGSYSGTLEVVGDATPSWVFEAPDHLIEVLSQPDFAPPVAATATGPATGTAPATATGPATTPK